MGLGGEIDRSPSTERGPVPSHQLIDIEGRDHGLFKQADLRTEIAVHESRRDTGIRGYLSNANALKAFRCKQSLCGDQNGVPRGSGISPLSPDRVHPSSESLG